MPKQTHYKHNTIFVHAATQWSQNINVCAWLDGNTIYKLKCGYKLKSLTSGPLAGWVTQCVYNDKKYTSAVISHSIHTVR